MIDVKDLSKSFGNLHVLNGINEHIYKGEKVVIIGPSGSGKSTFLRCLNLMEKPKPYKKKDGYGVPALQSVPPSDDKEKHNLSSR